MLHLNLEMRGDWHVKSVSVPKLVTLLQQIPAGSLVVTNQVGNLSVIREKDFLPLGYVDLGDEVYVPLEVRQ